MVYGASIEVRAWVSHRRDTHMVKTRFGDHSKIVVTKWLAPIVFCGGFKHVAHIDPSSQPVVQVSNTTLGH
jgi:hypothetical protein